MRFSIALLCAIGVLSTVGCGSSGNPTDSSVGGGTTTPASDPPLLTGLAPSEAQVGAPATTVIVYGSNFETGAAIQWNGEPLATTCVGPDLIAGACPSAVGVTANIPASDFATAGTSKVTVSNSSSAGGSSAPLTFTIAPPIAGRTWVRPVAGLTTPNDVVWDAANARLYVSISSSDLAVPNTLAAVEPVSGNVVTTMPAGNNPHLLSISSDSSYLWAGLDGDHVVQRFLLPGLTKEVSFPIPEGGPGAQEAVALQAAPLGSHTVALIAGSWGYSPTGNGVYVFDDATQRPMSSVGETTTFIDWMQWGASDSVIYGDQYTTIDTGGISTLNVTASGISYGGTSGGSLNPTITQFVPATGLLYSYGGAYDPVKFTLAGSFNLPESGAEACTADSALGRYYCVTTYSVGGTDITNFELWVFDLSNYALISRTLFGNTSEFSSNSTVTGAPAKLVRWGTSGLALVTTTAGGYGNGGLFLIDGADINPSVPADTTIGTSLHDYPAMKSMTPDSAISSAGQVQVTIEGTGFSPDDTACWNCSFLQLQLLPTTYVSPTELQATFPIAALPANATLAISVFDQGSNLFSQNALAFTIASSSGTTKVTPLNICGLSMAWDSNSQLLYVGTADYDGAFPNSIVAIDPASGKVETSSGVGPDPIFLADSAGGEFLYVAYAGSTNLTQLSLPGLSTTATAVLNGWQGGPWFPADLKVAPGDPHTTALTLFKPGFDPPAIGGIVVLDDSVQRPNLTPDLIGPGTALPYFNTVAWSSSDRLLTSAQNEGDSGPLFSLNLDSAGFTTGTQGSAMFNTYGAQIHSDFGTDYIYSDDGNVADPTSGAVVGRYQASGLVAPDSSLNRTFILGQTSSQAGSNNYTIQSFDEKAFGSIASITLNSVSGIPFELVRWGETGLAVLTMGGNGSYVDSLGMLYLLNDSTFVSNAPSANTSKAAKEDRVQQRWKRLSKTEMLAIAQRWARRASY